MYVCMTQHVFALLHHRVTTIIRCSGGDAGLGFRNLVGLISSVQYRQLRFENCHRPSNNGGALHISSMNLVFSDIVAINCKVISPPFSHISALLSCIGHLENAVITLRFFSQALLGGALYVAGSNTLQIIDSQFYNNSAIATGSAARGGAVAVRETVPSSLNQSSWAVDLCCIPEFVSHNSENYTHTHTQ